MYKASFATSNRGVPILSRQKIDEIGEKLVEDFRPDAMIHAQELDVDRFLTRYLGLDIDYKYLSHCNLYLGMTIFADCNKVPIFNPEEWRAEFISVKANTVLLDAGLLDERQEHRYRFTGMHEGSHYFLHADYFANMLNSNCAAGDYIPMVQCRVDRAKLVNPRSSKRTDLDWIEWQANQLASSILMPRTMVYKVVRQAERSRNSVNAGLEAVAAAFNVSTDAAYYRMCELGLRNDGKKRA